MPKKPKRPCSYPGCPNLTDGRFCLEHEKKENKRYEQYERSPEIKQRYGRVWKRIRDSYAKEHPLCEKCLEHDVFRAHDRKNLIALCKSCHATIHAERGDRWKVKPKYYR